MIQNRQHRVEKAELFDAGPLYESIPRLVGKKALRWYIAQVLNDEVVLEMTTDDGEASLFEDRLQPVYYAGKSAVLNIVPTGIGCSIGGFAGDAAPVTSLLASVADYLITNPNTVNASNFIGLQDRNVLYTDGCCIDWFCKGVVDLYVPYSNRIGLIVEKADDHSLDTVFNVVNSVRAVHGINIKEVVITEQSIGGRCFENQSGAFVGTIDHPHLLFEACDELLKRGVDAIAITTNIEDLPLKEYAKHFEGNYPNPIGGVEAIISYLVTSRYHLPCAHAPLMNIKQLDLKHHVVDARAAGEMASESGLACILIGLRNAPQIIAKPDMRVSDVISINNLLAIVTPASCLGGIPAIYAQKYNIPVIAVQENRTILDVTQEKLALTNIIEVSSYAEAAGMVLALRKGLSLESLSRPLKTFRY